MDFTNINYIVTKKQMDDVEKYSILLNCGLGELGKHHLKIRLQKWRGRVEYLGFAPLSTSCYIHELAEIDGFKKIEINPFDRSISKIFDENPDVHQEATKIEHQYLQNLLKSQGVNSSLGTIIRHNPTTESDEQRQINLIEFRKYMDQELPIVKSEIEPLKTAFHQMLKHEKYIL